MSPFYDAALFDLDGTIVQSHPGIIGSVKKMLVDVGWQMPDGFDYTRFIGPPIFESLIRLAKMPAPLAEEGIVIYRKYYNAGEIFNGSVYPGIPELFSALREQNVKVCVATSKPEPMAERVLEHFGISPLLDCVCAADTSDKQSNKEELILRALEICKVPKGRAVMIGDTRFDAKGAKIAGVDFIGAGYGYGSREEMEAFGLCGYVRCVPELLPLLLPAP